MSLQCTYFFYIFDSQLFAGEECTLFIFIIVFFTVISTFPPPKNVLFLIEAGHNGRLAPESGCPLDVCGPSSPRAYGLEA